MSSAAQITANRINAQSSTGPRTPQGKAASSRNAIKHNLSGTTFVLLPGEDRAAFDSLARDYQTEWRPKTPHENFLVNQMIQGRWRLNRIARMEADCISAILSTPLAEGHSDEAALIMADPLMKNNMPDKLHRYAREAERAYHRAARELLAYRKHRAQEPAAASQPVETKPAQAAPGPERNEAFSALPKRAHAFLDDVIGPRSRPNPALFTAAAAEGDASRR